MLRIGKRSRFLCANPTLGLLRAGGFGIVAISAAHAQPVPMYEGALPQAYTNTCQSQSLMLALALEQHPAFDFATAEELRGAEVSFRQLVNSIDANDDARTAAHHTVWRDAIAQYTLQHFSLELEYFDDTNEWAARVAELTQNRVSASTAVATRLLGAKKAVMTSLSSLGDGNDYADGHIVSVIGIDDTSVVRSNERHFLLAFNGAIKGAGGKMSCDATDLPGDERYSAGVTATNSYTLKDWNDQYLLMWLKAN